MPSKSQLRQKGPSPAKGQSSPAFPFICPLLKGYAWEGLSLFSWHGQGTQYNSVVKYIHVKYLGSSPGNYVTLGQ